MEKKTIPTSYEGLLVWSRNFVKCLRENMAVLNLDSGKVNALEVIVEKYQHAMEKARDPNHTRNDTGARVETANLLRKEISRFLSENISHNPAMTRRLQRALMITERRPPKKSKRPTRKPGIELTPDVARITARYYDPASGRHAKPAGVRGIQYCWDILSGPVESPEDLRHKVSMTSGVLDIHLKESDRGKEFSISARWENAVGETGPWADIIKIFIP